MKKLSKKKTKTRKILLQNLYSWEMTKNKNTYLNKDIQNINENKIDLIYLKYSLKNIIDKEKIIELIINTHIKTHSNINIIENIILKIAIFEIMFYKTPKKVMINESILLSKQFCLKNSHTLINKLLDNIIKEL